MTRRRSFVVLGLDLSLRSAAGCALGANWRPGEWGAQTLVCGSGLTVTATPAERAARLHDVAHRLASFAASVRADAVFVEDYAYGLAGRGGMMLAELGGAVKFEFHRLGLPPVVPVNASTARKYLLGARMPRKGAAVATHRLLGELGCPFGTSDERDAFVVANYGRTELGLPGLTLG